MKAFNKNYGAINAPLNDLFTRGFIFTLIFAYFLTTGNHVTYYQEKTSMFFLTIDYLSDFLARPGGILEWFALLLTSFFIHPVAGALILATIFLITFTSLQMIVEEISSKKSFLLPFSVACLTFWLQIDYQYLLVMNLGLLVQILFFLFMVKNRKYEWPLIILFPVWFITSGGFAWIGFLMIIIRIIILERFEAWKKVSVLILVIMVFVFLSIKYLYYLSLPTILSNPFTLSNTGNQLIAFHIAAGLIVLTPILSLIHVSGKWINRFESGKLYIIGKPAGAIILLFLAAALKHDTKTIHYFKCEKLFFEKRYNELIELNLKEPSSNYLTIYLNNIALCETGQLTDRLFSFPQSADGNTLFLKWEIVGEILRKGAYFYYTTGMINEAHRWAFEYMVMKGHTPEGLRMLIKTELINGNSETASKYIGLLKKTLFYRKEANEYEKLASDISLVIENEELGARLKIKTGTDFFTITDDPAANLARIVSSDSLNKNAYEYLMSTFLINKDYKSIVDQWGNLSRYNYKKIPLAISEAGIAISNLYNVQLPVVKGLTIDNTVRSRFDQYLMTFQKHGANPRAAEPELRKQFGTSFWYWVFYK